MARKVLIAERRAVLTDRRGSDASSAAAGRYPSLHPGVIAALQKFSGAGYELVLVGNRVEDDGTAVAAEEFETDNAFLTELLESQGIGIGSVRSCLHESGAGCDCHLPAVGLVHDVVADTGLDRAASLVVGRPETAMGLARTIGLRAIAIAPNRPDRAGEPGALSWPEIAHQILDAPRIGHVSRRTRETEITVDVDLDRSADPRISTGIGFFDHMLEQLGKHSGIALEVQCNGDLHVDEHHTVEDVAIAVGTALSKALGDKRGIHRYGFVLPMDESEARVSVDLSGRAYFEFSGDFRRESVGGLPTELVPHFFRSLSESLGATLHLSVEGENAHHMVEACFKGVARVLRMAFRRDGDEIPSTKGQL